MKSPISGSTVSLQVCLDASGCKGVAGLAPTHLQLLGERKMKRERGREKGERERERRTEGQLVSRLSGCRQFPDFLPLELQGAGLSPCVCFVVWGQEAALLCGYGQVDSSLQAWCFLKPIV